MTTGCGSLTKVSQPVLIEQCKAVAKELPEKPNDNDMLDPNMPVRYTQEQVAKGVSRTEVVDNQSTNNILWAKDRIKLKNLQEYIRVLQQGGIISK